MNSLGIVVPCYNESESIPLFIAEVHKVFQAAGTTPPKIELLFVDDGSSDDTLSVLEQAQSPAPFITIRYISFSRNFGKEAALYAGLCNIHGTYVATMDADLQDPPMLLPEMIDTLENSDYDCVATKRDTREGEPVIRSFFSRKFYQIINKLTDTNIVDGARDFRMMNRAFVDAVLSLSETNRFTKGIYAWVGFKTKWISYPNIERSAGTTKWNFFSLFSYAIDGIVAFSTKPLTAVSYAGFALCGLSIVAVVIIACRALLFSDPVAGWPSLACIITFIGGLQLFGMGLLGQYLAKIYTETKDRPIYIIRKRSEDEK